MENIDASKLSNALLRRYTEQIKPPSVSGGSIFYGLACMCCIFVFCFFQIIIVLMFFFF